MTDNRSERLRRRRKQSKANRTDQEPTTDGTSSETSKPDKPPTQSGSTDADGTDTDGAETDGTDTSAESSVKEEQIGTYMYLPESQTKELRRQYNILKAEYEFEYDEEFQKNRHFYPLVVQYGLESLEEMDASEIRDHLQRIL